MLSRLILFFFSELKTKAFYLIVLCVLITLFTGIKGFYEEDARSFLDALYLTLQLFTLESGMAYNSKEAPQLIQIARFSGFLAAFGSVIGFALELFQKKLIEFAISKLKDHAVFSGIDENIFYLLTNKDKKNPGWLENEKSKPVVVIKATDSKLRQLCKENGIVYLIGDLERDESLKQINIIRAKYCFAFSDDDNKNFNVGLNIYRFFKASGSQERSSNLKLYFHLKEQEHIKRISDHDVFNDSSDSIEHFFSNYYSTVARELFEVFPVSKSRQAESIEENSYNLVIFGFGIVGQNLLVQARKLCHFPSGLKIKFHIIDHNIDEKKRSFTLSNPNFMDYCGDEISFSDFTMDSGNYVENSLNKLKIENKSSFFSILICFEDDFINYSFYKDLIPIVLRKLELSFEEKNKKINWSNVNRSQRVADFKRIFPLAVYQKNNLGYFKEKVNHDSSDKTDSFNDAINALRKAENNLTSCEHERWLLHERIFGFDKGPVKEKRYAKTNPNMLAWQQILEKKDEPGSVEESAYKSANDFGNKLLPCLLKFVCEEIDYKIIKSKEPDYDFDNLDTMLDKTLYSFGGFKETFNWKKILYSSSDLDLLAKLINDYYWGSNTVEALKKSYSEGKTEENWNKISEVNKISSRASADHIRIKLAELGYELVKK